MATERNGVGPFLDAMREVAENDLIRDFVRRQMKGDLEAAVPPTVRYKRTMANAVVPFYATPWSAGFDLSTAEEVVIRPNSIAQVTTGLIIATPADHYMRITGRSSTPNKFGVQVIEGVIDEDYCGDDDVLRLQLWNFTEEPKRVPLQSRIAQGIFVPITRVKFDQADAMGKSRGGFGSTG